MKHWILNPSTAQSIITNLDTNRMALKAAKNYYLAYGVAVSGNTKDRFIKELCRLVKGDLFPEYV